MQYEERLLALEVSVRDLKKQLSDAQLETKRAKAAVEVQSVLGRYSFYYMAQMYTECAKLWAKREDSSVDVGGGPGIGYEDAICGDYSPERIDPDGLFRIHALCTPVVEVAADCKTARAVFISPGIDTEVSDGKASCKWCWIKYGADFIMENEKWYIWHLTAYGLFHTDYYTSWGDAEPKPLRREIPLDADGNPASPPGDKHGGPKRKRGPQRDDWTYAKDRRPVLDPVPPEPYKTFSDVGTGYLHM